MIGGNRICHLDQNLCLSNLNRWRQFTINSLKKGRVPDVGGGFIPLINIFSLPDDVVPHGRNIVE